MTVYPLIFDLGPLRITGYGLMMMVGFLVAGWSIQRQLLQRGMNQDYAADIVVASVIGGIIGARLWYVALTQDVSALFSRSGLVWYGGFLGGCAGVIINGWMKKVPLRLTMDLCAPAVTIGYVLGRVGCFLVQDDYGVATDGPWGMRFPQGLPPSTAANLSQQFGAPVPDGVNPADVLAVHPTQLYEVTIMMVVFWVLWRLRQHTHGIGWLFGLYLVLAGAERFVIEIVRAKDDRFFGPFTLAQLTSVTIAVVGISLMAKWMKQDALEIPADSTVMQAS